MDGHTLIINHLGTLAQGLSASDRWKAMRGMGGTGGHAHLMWWILIALGILAAAGTIAALVYARRQEHRKWEKFGTLGRNAGLREKELTLLKRVVKLARLKVPATIYTEEGAFNAAAMGLMSSAPVAALSDKAQLDLQTTIISIHAKLRFGVVDDGDDLDIFRSSHQIATGSRVFVARMGDRQSVEAAIARNSRTELLITAEEELPGRRGGDVLTIRYAHGHGAWEFDARVIRCDGPAVAVTHSRQMRAVNFRRFPRIPTKMFATGMAFPFHVDSCEASLELIPADIVEIAGPGLLIKLPVETDVGQNLLIRVQLDTDRFIQGMTKVRRIVTDKPGGPFLAVEFIELSADELTEMTRATNLAASHKGRRPAESQMATV